MNTVFINQRIIILVISFIKNYKSTFNRLKYTDLFVKNKKYIDTDLVEESLPLTKEISAFVFFYAMTGNLSFIKCKYTQITYIFIKDDEDKRTLGVVKYITTVEELYEI